MADELIRRRELRRRKILENPEGRLKKLLGENACTDNEDNAVKFTAPSSSRENIEEDALIVQSKVERSATVLSDVTNKTSTPLPKILPKPVEEKDQEELVLFNQFTQRDFPVEHDSSGGDSPPDLVEISLLLNEIKPSPIQRHQIPKIVDDSPSVYSRRDSSSSVPVVLATRKYWLSKPEIRRSLFAALAISFYICLFWDFLVFGESIILPFVTLQLSIIGYETIFVSSTDSFRPITNTAQSLLNGALLLSGVSEAAICKISLALWYVRRLMEELSIYLFTFFLLHWTVQVVTI